MLQVVVHYARYIILWQLSSQSVIQLGRFYTMQILMLWLWSVCGLIIP